jgi:Tol biopolymer transport system component
VPFVCIRRLRLNGARTRDYFLGSMVRQVLEMRLMLRASFVCGLLTWGLLIPAVLAEPMTLSGRLALPFGADLLLISASSGEQQVLTLHGDALVSSVAWSPDGQRLAVARSSRPPGDSLFGQDIAIVNAADGGAISMIQRDKPGVILDTPVWSSDGEWLFFDRQETVRSGVEYRIERARPDGTELTIVVENARAPSLSPDGSRLAFIRSDRSEVLYAAEADGQREQPLVPTGKFLLINYPRFSPDGQWIVFATVTDETQVAPTPTKPGTVRAFSSIEPGLNASPRRHGIPWDIWLVRADGRDLRVARLAEDDPSVAWSPDGSGIAVYGGRGLGVMDTSGDVQRLRDEIIGFGGIDWTR